MADERIRSFVAVDLPDPARRAAAEVARALRTSPGGEAVRWVRAEALHVTLRFLGNVETSRISALVEHVAAAIGGLASFRLELGGVHVFPLRRPRVIALDVAVGDAVTSGQRVLVIEAMKMQHEVTATLSGTVVKVMTAVGDQVSPRTPLVELEPD